MFILCKPYNGDSDKVLINLSEITTIEARDNIINCHTKDGERYLVSYYADEKGYDGWERTTFEALIKAIAQKWPTFCGFLDREDNTSMEQEGE